MNTKPIEEALEAATPGPWKIDLWPRTDEIGIQKNDEITEYVALLSKYNRNKHNDARFIANAPEWIRQLLEERKVMLESVKYACFLAGCYVSNESASNTRRILRGMLKQIGEL